MQVGYMRAFIRRAGNEADDAGAPVPFVASTEGIKRDGLDLRAEDWLLDSYNTFSPVLWAHDYTGSSLPLGTGSARMEGRELHIDVSFDTSDEFAMRVRDKALRGMIAGSVGWGDIRKGTRVMHELLEFSMVPVPADPSSLPMRQVRGLAQDYADLLGYMDDPDLTPGDASWEENACGMLRVFSPDAWTSERDRRIAYNRISRRYRLAGKRAPEFFTLRDLDALGPAEIAGLFLEGEAALFPGLFQVQRAGAVLSTRNESDLREAARLITGVLDRAQKADKGAEADATAAKQSDEERAAAQELESVTRLLDVFNQRAQALTGPR